MGERFLFYPSVGFCLVAALLLDKWAGKAGKTGLQVLKHPGVLGLLIPVCLVYALVTIERNGAWYDNLTLYTTDVNKNPNNSRLNYFLGYELFKRHNLEGDAAVKEKLLADAILYYRRSLAIYPEYGYPKADLGAAYFRRGQFDSAEVYDKKALLLAPDDVTTSNNLSAAYMEQKKYRENIDHSRQAIALLPGNIYAYADIGLCYMYLGKYDSAIQYLDRGIAVDPKFYGFYDVKGSVYTAMGKPDSAQKYKAMAQNGR